MKIFGLGLALLVLAAALVPGRASALDVGGEISARAWGVSASGVVNRTDLDTLGFDSTKGHPEFSGSIVLDERHHFGVSYLRIRRQEQGIGTGLILGLIRFNAPLSMDLSADDLRFRYGYSIVDNPWIDLQPFIDVGWVRESSTTVEGILGQQSHQRESVVFPMVGTAIVVAPSLPVRLRARAEGITTGRDHLLDVQGGAEAQIGYAFFGLGYRHVDVTIGKAGADVQLEGIYLEGGLRF